jgi:hypothetical protein
MELELSLQSKPSAVPGTSRRRLIDSVFQSIQNQGFFASFLEGGN